jgi:uncharacterized membrane protein YhaH (DUF805 family)
VTAYFDAMRRYFDFSGRSTRSQFWLFTLIVLVLGIIGIVLDASVLGSSEPSLFSSIVYLAHLIPSIGVTVRRLHDSDRRGWWVLIGLVPLVGVIALIVFGCLPSSTGHNRFGSPASEHTVASATAAPTARKATQGVSTVDQLEKLAAMRASGAIDDAEFQRMKADLLRAEH